MRLKSLLWVIAISQLVLGALVLFLPNQFFFWMGLSRPQPDNLYMLGMLASRFLAYGIGMVFLARQPIPSRFWMRNMVLVQALDFAVGAAYLAQGVVTVSVVAFPMFNALVFGSLLWLWTRKPSVVA